MCWKLGSNRCTSRAAGLLGFSAPTAAASSRHVAGPSTTPLLRADEAPRSHSCQRAQPCLQPHSTVLQAAACSWPLSSLCRRSLPGSNPPPFCCCCKNNCSHPSFWSTHIHTHTICTQFGTEDLHNEKEASTAEVVHTFSSCQRRSRFTFF